MVGALGAAAATTVADAVTRRMAAEGLAPEPGAGARGAGAHPAVARAARRVSASVG